MNTVVRDPVVDALNARIRMIGTCLRRGDPEGALRLVEQVERVMPLPPASNWLAAKQVLKLPRRKG